jgi:hypothetical protein
VLRDKGSFWWRYPLKLCDMYGGIAQCAIDNGSTVIFWLDIWNEHLLQQKYPMLYSYAKNKNTLVAQFLHNNIIEEQFHLPLSVQAYQDLHHTIQLIQISTEDKNKWKYIWGHDKYASAKFYNLPYKNIHPPKPFMWIIR